MSKTTQLGDKEEQVVLESRITFQYVLLEAE